LHHQHHRNTDHLPPNKGTHLAARRAIDLDYVEDLLIYIKRGMTVTAAAEQAGMSRATAYRLLKEHRAREAAR
jgi:predicted DNA-binding protein (UPF0251 family)